MSERSPSPHVLLRDVFGHEREVVIFGSTLIGTLASCALRLDDPAVSRLHALLTPDGSDLWAGDLGSANGTWLNGCRLDRPARLAGGDIVRVGRNTLLVVT